MLASRQASYTAVPPTLPQQEFSGKVVGVIDGDTIDVLHNGKAERIRLHGIDCPERNQPFGYAAKKEVTFLIFGKEVTVKAMDVDSHGRTVGEVTLTDRRSLNKELVRLGYAWWYRKYAPRDVELARLEEEARKDRRGLWTDKDPIAPWDWRHPN